MHTKNRCRPAVEGLEHRALMAVVNLPGAVIVAPQAQPLTLKIQAVRNGPNSVSLTLTETNSSTRTVRVSDGCGVADFWITQGGVEVWRKSQGGPQPLCPIRNDYPLGARRSRTFEAEWTGNITGQAPPNPGGPLVAHASVDGLEASVVVAGSSVPGEGVLTVRVSPSKATYRVGETVRLTVTETNTGGQPIYLGVCGPSEVTIRRGGTVVWKSVNRKPCSLIAMELAPGASRTYTVTWPGRFNMNTSLPRTGTFTATVVIDGTTAVGSFVVRR
jgi:hypothetical protein